MCRGRGLRSADKLEGNGLNPTSVGWNTIAFGDSGSVRMRGKGVPVLKGRIAQASDW